MKRCVVLFTKAPIKNKTKTRLQDFLSSDDILIFHTKLIKNITRAIKKTGYDFFVAYTPKKEIDIIKDICESKDENSYISQIDDDNIGSRMLKVFEDLFSKGYEKIILLGSDIYNIDKNYIKNAMNILDEKDIVISKTLDGGYALIGMRKLVNVFDIEKYSTNTVFEETLNKIKEKKASYKILKPLRDIDTKYDMICAYLNVDQVQDIGTGEYNMNYLYTDKNNIKKVFRINTKSQMNLKNQIQYEYKALKELEKSSVTPKVYFYDDSKIFFPYGVLSMQYLKGSKLDYDKDIDIAIYLLTKLHSTKISKNTNIIESKKPFYDMYSEFETMYKYYKNYEKKDITIEKKIDELLKKIKNMGVDDEIIHKSIVNTELNNTNFIIGDSKEKSYIIDFEKPLISDREMDIAHFLAPTTTFWRTNTIFNIEQIDDFIEKYSSILEVDKKRVYKYLCFTCLRGITWCSMAYVEYSKKEKMIQNEYAFEKIKKYLDIRFLENIEKFIDKVNI